MIAIQGLNASFANYVTSDSSVRKSLQIIIKPYTITNGPQGIQMDNGKNLEYCIFAWDLNICANETIHDN